jgi:hypothetical protein
MKPFMKTSIILVVLVILTVMATVHLILSNQRSSETISFEGTVKHIPLEGGFYGIVSSQGNKFDPVNLAPPYQLDELRVRVRAMPQPEKVSFHMWGKIIKIVDIQKMD